MTVSGGEAYDLALQQQRLWALQPEGPTLWSQGTAPVTGVVDEAELRAALERAAGPYEILRTTFQRPTGMHLPLQVVGDRAALRWSAVDLSDLPADEQAARSDELCRVEATRPFDLRSGPVLAGLLLRLGADRARIVVTAPAVVADGPTVAALAADAVAAGGAVADDDPLQYADFAVWQRELIADGEATSDDHAWWTERVTDAPETRLPLFGDPQPAKGLELTPAPVEGFAAALAALAGRLGAAPSDVALTAWAVVVARLTASDDVVLGVVCDGRGSDELSGARGPFACTLPVRLELGASATLAEAVTRVASARAEAVRRQDQFLPSGAGPAGPAGTGWPPVGWSWDEPGVISAHPDGFQAKLSCSEGGAQLWSDAGAAEDGQATRVARHLSAFLASAVAAPGADVWQIDLWPESDHAEVVAGFNAASSRPSKAAGAIPQLFGAQAARTPGAIAVVAGDGRLSYAELDARANQVAHLLRSEGVRPGDVVALLLDRSVELVVALVGVLKAGAAYLPLHLDHPPARLAFQLHDAGARALVTRDAFAERVGPFAGALVILERAAGTLASQPTTAPPDVAVEPEDVAYLIYTSGSTGVPKAVAVTHGGVCNYADHIVGELKLGEGDPQHVGMVTTLSTDLGNTAVFPTLLAGGCLHLVPMDVAMDGGSLAGYVREHPLDVLKVTPSHLAALLVTGGAAVLPRRSLVVGGEALPWALADEVATMGTCAVINHYGPTETTIGSLTFRPAEAGPRHRRTATVPIGRPIANTVAYVVDRHGAPVPVGTPGELWLGGAGLARGYWGRPEQTAERFVANPFGGDRVYRTGDLARFLGDGSVEFLGRIDDQVKIRGYRVELAEIEHVVRSHPDVDQAAVVLRHDDDNPRLVGYFVPGARLPTAEAIRAFLADRLPEHMVPVALVNLTALPMRPNGKLDRAALPAPDQHRAPDQARVAPRSPTEETIAAIWADVLGLEVVGVEEDFFELGGHSLLATQVIARIRNAVGVQLPLHSLFTSPTVAGLAAAVEAALAAVATTDDDLATILDELEDLSDEEAERLLELEASQDDQ